jgi:hypothetical protein
MISITVESSIRMPVGWQILILDNRVIYTGRTDVDVSHIEYDTIVLNPLDVARIKAAPTMGTA